MTENDESKPDQFYWSIDFPGLTEEQAERIVAFARDELGLSGWRRGILVDPRSFYATWLDRETVETIRTGLISINQDGCVDNMIEGIDDWLRQAELFETFPDQELVSCQHRLPDLHTRTGRLLLRLR